MTKAHQDLLTTKIYRPPLPADCVQRSDLLRLLDAGRSRPLTLVSAPAGYGKSVLVSSWLEASDWASIWISLDENDSELKNFLSYLILSVRERFPQAFEATQGLPKADAIPDPQAVASVVSNELDAIDRPFILVLDDYHRIHARSPVNEVLRFLLDYPPIPLHLVLLTRRDPALPLSQLRALGQVTDLRMRDLQFSTSETQELLEKAVHIRASQAAIANLEHELEGWVAGLRLMTLALRYAPDADVFMKRLHGGTKQMREYLINEVMARLPKPFREWLLPSALMDRFCASLCEAINIETGTSQTDAITGHRFIEYLKEVNLFLIPLDSYGQWFRFHHLFQKFLQSELSRQVDAQTIAALYIRASNWFEENGFLEEAVQSALKADDWNAAADIVERHHQDELENMNFHTVERWLELLRSIPADRPRLRLAEAFVAIRQFDIPRLVATLEEVAPGIQENPDYKNLMGGLRCLQGVVSFRMGNGETSLKMLQEVRHWYQDSEKRGIAGMAAFHEALSLVLCGRGAEALAKFEDLAARAASGNPIYHSMLLAALVIVSYHIGDLARSANDAIRLEGSAQKGESKFSYGLSLYFQACSGLQRGDLEAAARCFETNTQQRYTMPRQGAFQAMAGLALCRQFLQNENVALRVIRDLRSFARELNDANGLKVARSCEARIQLLQGDVKRAAQWAGFDSAIPMFAELFNSLEVPAITRARVWIALGTDESLDRAYKLLQQIGEQARSWHFLNQTIEADVLKSLALPGLGREEDALEILAGVIDLAAPGGWMRPFLEPGEPMADLIARLDRQGLATDFSRQLHDHIQAWQLGVANHARVGSDLQVMSESGSYETLTPRELDVLELLAHRLQNKEISDQLFISLETVKSHLKKIYQKLDVGKRRDAVKKARKLEII